MNSENELTPEEVACAGAPGAVAPTGGAAPRLGTPVVPEAHGPDPSERWVSALDLARRALHSLVSHQDPALERDVERAIERLTLASNQGELAPQAVTRLEAQQQPLAARLSEVIQRMVQAVEGARL